MNIQAKPWLAQTIDVFEGVRTNSISQQNFIDQLMTLTRQVQASAKNRFEVEDAQLIKLATKAYGVVFESCETLDEKVSSLVCTKLFKLIVSTRTESLKAKDHKYYSEDIVGKMITGFANRMRLDLSYIQDNPNVQEWVCAVTETQQTPQQRRDMRKTMSHIPLTEYYATQAKRVEIGALITTKALCMEIKQLLENPENLASEEVKHIVKRYQTEVLDAFPQEAQMWVRRNLIVSLDIRSGQLP